MIRRTLLYHAIIVFSFTFLVQAPSIIYAQTTCDEFLAENTSALLDQGKCTRLSFSGDNAISCSLPVLLQNDDGTTTEASFDHVCCTNGTTFDSNTNSCIDFSLLTECQRVDPNTQITREGTGRCQSPEWDIEGAEACFELEPGNTRTWKCCDIGQVVAGDASSGLFCQDTSEYEACSEVLNSTDPAIEGLKCRVGDHAADTANATACMSSGQGLLEGVLTCCEPGWTFYSNSTTVCLPENIPSCTVSGYTATDNCIAGYDSFPAGTSCQEQNENTAVRSRLFTCCGSDEFLSSTNQCLPRSGLELCPPDPAQTRCASTQPNQLVEGAEPCLRGADVHVCCADDHTFQASTLSCIPNETLSSCLDLSNGEMYRCGPVNIYDGDYQRCLGPGGENWGCCPPNEIWPRCSPVSNLSACVESENSRRCTTGAIVHQGSDFGNRHFFSCLDGENVFSCCDPGYGLVSTEGDGFLVCRSDGSRANIGNINFDDFNPLALYGSQNETGPLSAPGLILNRFLSFFAFPLAGLILFLMLLWGGFEVLVQSPSKKNITAGRQRITAAIIGFILLFASYWIVQIIEVVFGITIL